MKSNTIALVSSASMTGTAEVDSIAIPLEQIYGFSITAYWTGSAVGTFKLQCSNDDFAKDVEVSNGGPYVVTNWSDINGSSAPTGGATGNFTWNFNGSFFKFVRLVYTNASSTGTLNAVMNVKG